MSGTKLWQEEALAEDVFGEHHSNDFPNVRICVNIWKARERRKYEGGKGRGGGEEEEEERKGEEKRENIMRKLV